MVNTKTRLASHPVKTIVDCTSPLIKMRAVSARLAAELKTNICVNHVLQDSTKIQMVSQVAKMIATLVRTSTLRKHYVKFVMQVSTNL